MAGVIAPHIQPMGNALGIENVRHPHILILAHIALTGGQHDAHSTVPAQKPVVADIRHVIRRAVEVAVIIVMPVEKLMDIESSAHAHALGH